MVFSECGERFTVSIVGGGLGGLTLAIGLLQRNVSVQIFEAAPAFRETGLGLSIGPAAHRALPLINSELRKLYDALVTTHADSLGFEAFRQTWFEVIWGEGEHAGEQLMNLQALPSGQTTLGRADYLNALTGLVPPELVHFGKRLETMQETTDGVELSFADGTQVTAEVVIGCDGIKSRVKECMFGLSEATAPKYSGMSCYRAVIDMEDMVKAVGDRRARVASWYLCKGSYLITYPIMRAKKVSAGFHLQQPTWEHYTWIRNATREDLDTDCRDKSNEVKAILALFEDTSQWAVFEHPPIPTFHQSRIVLLGDAAHASSPHQGAGAGQAIEDAYVLSELLADSRVSSAIEAKAAFEAYDAIRRPRSQMVVETSRENADLLCLVYPGVEDDGEKLKPIWRERFRWLWDLDVVQHAEDAKHLMHKILDDGSKQTSSFSSRHKMATIFSRKDLSKKIQSKR